jgi:hypothetical protein
MASSIQVSFVVEFETDGETVEEVMNAALQQDIRDHAAAIARHYDTTSISSGFLTSSITGTEAL